MTIQMSFLGSFFGAVVALPFAIFAANNVTSNRVVNLVVRFILTVVRTIPDISLSIDCNLYFWFGYVCWCRGNFLFSFSF